MADNVGLPRAVNYSFGSTFYMPKDGISDSVFLTDMDM
jgi:hypothetical protein